MSLERQSVALVVAGLVFSSAGHAWAQTTPPPPGGTFAIERVQSGPVAAADVKVTDFDGTAGTLVGGYAGWLSDQRLLVGGAGYWLANGSNSERLAYGGLLVGWTFRGDSRIGFGVRGLVGAGQGRLAESIRLTRTSLERDQRLGPFTGRSPGGAANATEYRYWLERGFFVFEPQGHVVIRLADEVRLDCSAGYRLAAAADGLEDQFAGATGSVAIRFGGGR